MPWKLITFLWSCCTEVSVLLKILARNSGVIFLDIYEKRSNVGNAHTLCNKSGASQFRFHYIAKRTTCGKWLLGKSVCFLLLYKVFWKYFCFEKYLARPTRDIRRSASCIPLTCPLFLSHIFRNSNLLTNFPQYLIHENYFCCSRGFAYVHTGRQLGGPELLGDLCCKSPELYRLGSKKVQQDMTFV
jgi:hypothetical protein